MFVWEIKLIRQVQQAFIKVYPWIVTGFETTLLAYDVAYLFNKTDYFRPWHKLLRVKIERAVPDEVGTMGKEVS